MADYFLVRRDGSRDGPYSEEDLLDFLDADELSAGAVCEDAATGRRVRVSDLFKVIPPAKDGENQPPPPPRVASGVKHSPFPKAPATAESPETFKPWQPAQSSERIADSSPPRRAGAGRVCFRGHPSLLVHWRSLLVAALLAAAGALAGQINRDWETPGLTAGLGSALLLLCVVFLRRSARRYVITTRHVERQDGILSVSSREARLEDIRAINVTKTGLRGLFGVGTVNFSTAAGDEDDVTFHDVSHAHAMKELVRRLQDRLE